MRRLALGLSASALLAVAGCTPGMTGKTPAENTFGPERPNMVACDRLADPDMDWTGMRVTFGYLADEVRAASGPTGGDVYRALEALADRLDSAQRQTMRATTATAKRRAIRKAAARVRPKLAAARAACQQDETLHM